MHKQIFEIRTNLQRFQPSKVNVTIGCDHVYFVQHMMVIFIVLIPYISNEIINVGFKRLSYDFYSDKILHSHTVVHVLSPIVTELSDFMM